MEEFERGRTEALLQATMPIRMRVPVEVRTGRHRLADGGMPGRALTPSLGAGQISSTGWETDGAGWSGE